MVFNSVFLRFRTPPSRGFRQLPRQVDLRTPSWRRHETPRMARMGRAKLYTRSSDREPESLVNRYASASINISSRLTMCQVHKTRKLDPCNAVPCKVSETNSRQRQGENMALQRVVAVFVDRAL